MKAAVDQDSCQGHARCIALLPEVFDTDEFGHAVVQDGGQEAVASCPERAVHLIE